MKRGVIFVSLKTYPVLMVVLLLIIANYCIIFLTPLKT